MSVKDPPSPVPSCYLNFSPNNVNVRGSKLSSRSWYKQGCEDGPIMGPWCGSTLHYLEAIGTPRYEDYCIKYRARNRYIYLGNRKSEVEGRKGDMSWYIGGGTHPFRSDLV